MTAHAMIEEARADGLELRSNGGKLKLLGPAQVVERWKPRIVASKSEILAALQPAPASRWWLIHYPDRDPLQVASYPGATKAQVLQSRPDAVAAEPFTPIIRQPSAPLTASEEMAVRAWLALFEETDPEIIAEIIGQCQRDADIRDYYIRHGG